MPDTTNSGSDNGLVVCAEGQQPALLRHLMLFLNY